MHDAMWKLRALAVKAHSKIWANRAKKDPAKWPVEGQNAAGERDWRICPIRFLFDKLHEEAQELEDAVLNAETIENIRKEAGDVAAVAMMLVDRCDGYSGSFRGPKVVCLCGSTKFKDAFAKAQFEETMKGYIVLSVGAFMHHDKILYRDGEKEMLDDLHKRKIDLADEILVVNVGGYIGESTRGEILYALGTGKDIRYVEPPAVAQLDPRAAWPFPTISN